MGRYNLSFIAVLLFFSLRPFIFSSLLGAASPRRIGLSTATLRVLTTNSHCMKRLSPLSIPVLTVRIQLSRTRPTHSDRSKSRRSR
ncbi:hypothetical protein BDD12DRAFT_819831 [Trichophaea hybrida]|nr:hypothetical protein BDD12DRAFT_819831 [Trichophaea hybrida]